MYHSRLYLYLQFMIDIFLLLLDVSGKSALTIILYRVINVCANNFVLNLCNVCAKLC